MKGVVKRWLSHRGYGFIDAEEENGDVFIHYSEIQGAYDLKGGKKLSLKLSTHIRGLEQ